ncbi:hypothetical protein EON63_07320 [archaeon]|nr:MAG: hypothetical protein EON63_07320 [archaeon]
MGTSVYVYMCIYGYLCVCMCVCKCVCMFLPYISIPIPMFTGTLFVDGMHSVWLSLDGEQAYGRKWILLERTDGKLR